jgi:hypothetical protein
MLTLFTESKRGSVARAAIGMKMMTESGKVGSDVFELEEGRPEIKKKKKGKPSYAVVSEGSERCLRTVVSIIQQNQQHGRATDLPSSLFILNMSILSVLNTAFSAPSHMISRPFDGFCKLLDLIYAHSFLTTCGRESESSWTSAARGSLPYRTL